MNNITMEVDDGWTSFEKIPKKIFIVPYRNRGPQMYFFCKWFNEFILKDMNKDDYKIFFSHQYDKKAFNRGAIKNIGFIIAKKLYPNDYKNITFIFNDIDCVPYKNIFSYETEIGTVAHYYGFEHSLGGIVVIKGVDFENINGFINLYTWGQEDRCLQMRCERNNLIIDRTNFYKIGSKEILQLFDGVNRIINNKELNRVVYDRGDDGIDTIHNLFYTMDKTSKNKEDLQFMLDESENIFVINIYNFATKYNNHKMEDFKNYDIRKPEAEIFKPSGEIVSNIMVDDWTNIPLFSKINNNGENQIGIPYNGAVIRNNNIQNNQKINNNVRRSYFINGKEVLEAIKQNDNNNGLLLTQQKRLITPTEIYSRSYANNKNIKPRATTSVRVGMGGVKI